MEKARILLDTPADSPMLGFGPIAVALAALIEESEPRFAVGIFGGWGSGKTTLMDAIHRELNRTDTVKVAFNAWRYEREPHLIVPLLDTIRGALLEYAENHPEVRAAVVKAAMKVGQVVKALISGVSAEFTIGVAKVAFDAGQSIEALEDTPSPAGPQSLYYACFEQLSDAFRQLRESGVARIVVFVEDLDRCLPPNALAVIESMKLFFDLVGFVFVVGVDQVVLEKAVRERLAGPSGSVPAGGRYTRLAEREYIKKIFQVPYELPPMTAQQLDELLEAMYRNGQIEGRQLDDLHTTVRPYLAHIANDDQVNPREVKRFINAYTLQMLIRPQLDRRTVLAVQTLVFRDDWALYDILRAETEAMSSAIARYRDNWNSALTDLWPEIDTVPTDLARFLRSPEADPLMRDDLGVYLSSVETTVPTERWVAEAYAVVAQLRRKARSVPQMLAQGVGASQVDRAGRDLGSLISTLRNGITNVADSDRLVELLQNLTHVVQRLHGAMNGDAAEGWAGEIERSIGDLQREIRLFRTAPMRPDPIT